MYSVSHAEERERAKAVTDGIDELHGLARHLIDLRDAMIEDE